MSTITNRNGFSGGYTATVWTLSGLVLAACGGGGSSSGGGRNIPTGLNYNVETFMVDNGIMMFRAPQHANARATPYDFGMEMIDPDTRIETMMQVNRFAAPSVVSAASVSGAGLEAAAFEVGDLANLEMGQWVRLITSDTNDAIDDKWDGKFFLTSLSNDKLMVTDLFVKFVDGVTLSNFQMNLDPSQIHKVYFEADVFRNGDNDQGDVRATVLVNPDADERADGYVAGDVHLAIRATDEPSEQTFTIRRNSFNEQDFRNNAGEWADIDGSGNHLTSANKNLVGFLVGGGLGPNYLRWISQDGASTHPNGFFVLGDTFYADFYADVPEDWDVRLIWWLDDVLGDMDRNGRLENGETNDFTGFTIPDDPISRSDLPGFDDTLDFNFQGILANPMMPTTTISNTNPTPGTQAYEFAGAHMIDSNGFSDITDSSNHFRPDVAGRYYVQVIIYDTTAQNPQETAHFGFDNLHEIDVLPDDTPNEIFQTYYVGNEIA